jgi:hypothetical protein
LGIAKYLNFRRKEINHRKEKISAKNPKKFKIDVGIIGD